jgi:hypothetical protein
VGGGRSSANGTRSPLKRDDAAAPRINLDYRATAGRRRKSASGGPLLNPLHDSSRRRRRQRSSLLQHAPTQLNLGDVTRLGVCPHSTYSADWAEPFRRSCLDRLQTRRGRESENQYLDALLERDGWFASVAALRQQRWSAPEPAQRRTPVRRPTPPPCCRGSLELDVTGPGQDHQ